MVRIYRIMTERPLFNVAQLLKEPVGSTRHSAVDVRLQDLVPDLKKQLPSEDLPEMHLAGPVRLMHTVTGVLVQGDLHGSVNMQCVRCLESVLVPIEVPVEENFEPTLDIVSGQEVRPEEQDEALWIDEHHVLDLSEVLRQDVLVALPMHVLCRTDCLGLCPTCGKNLNEGPCDCTTETDPRWALLSDLLRNDEDNSSEKE